MAAANSTIETPPSPHSPPGLGGGDTGHDYLDETTGAWGPLVHDALHGASPSVVECSNRHGNGGSGRPLDLVAIGSQFPCVRAWVGRCWAADRAMAMEAADGGPNGEPHYPSPRASRRSLRRPLRSTGRPRGFAGSTARNVPLLGGWRHSRPRSR